MFLECDEIAVLKEDWDKIKSGDKDCIENLCTKLDGIELYMHAIGFDPQHYTNVSIRELCDAGVIESVTIKTEKYYSNQFYRESGTLKPE